MSKIIKNTQELRKKSTKLPHESTRKNLLPTGSSKLIPETKSKDEKKTKIVVKIPSVRTSAVAKPKSTLSGPSALKTPKVSSIDLTTTKRRVTNTKAETTRIIKNTQQPKITKKEVSTKPNSVLDTYHNVTVTSPPTKRKEPPPLEKNQEENPTTSRTRTRTRTLDREEIVILKSETPPCASLKEPVAFEIKFDDEKPKLIPPEKTSPLSDDNSSYEDDFESYESDFETETSSTGESTENGTNSKSENKMTSPTISDDEESEQTQYPITVIHRDKELERKLDSGNFDLKMKTPSRSIDLQQQQHNDSLDTISVTNSEKQLDSGISYSDGRRNSIYSSSVIYGGYTMFFKQPIITNNGLEIIRKIQFDSISFKIFEQKPMSYEIFMRTYGKLNSTQASAQTNENRMTAECQSDECDTRIKWTQHPPHYDLSIIRKFNSLPGTILRNCCGESLSETNQMNQKNSNFDPFERSIHALNNLRDKESRRAMGRKFPNYQTSINYERLNRFLTNSSFLIANILNSTENHRNFQSISSNGFLCKLETGLLNALRVVRIFANPRFNIILTVHESITGVDVYRSDFANLIMVWISSEPSKPFRLLSSWSEVCRAEICNETSEIIVAGLRDGSVAMWDLRETLSFCSLDGHLPHFAATQSIVPNLTTASLDFGAVVDIKSFRPRRKIIKSEMMSSNMSTQFASLNDNGILTVWTLIKTGSSETPNTNTATITNSKTEYISPWARVKLIQSAICNLREVLEIHHSTKNHSKFEKTKNLFMKNIFSDEVLRELNVAHPNENDRKYYEGLRFTSIDTGCEQIFICTNRNFILICSRTLKVERFRKILIDNYSRFLFPTALRVLSEDYIACGLANGSVILLNCNRKTPILSSDNEHRKLLESSESQQEELENSNPEIGKSCAIQNIIRNERRMAEVSTMALENEHYRPNTAATYVAMVTEKKKPFEMKTFDQEILLNGSVLRKNLIQSLEVSNDGWKLFAISDGDYRTYDFYTENEISAVDTGKGKINDICIAKGVTNEEQLILFLDQDNDVRLHVLK